MTMCVQMQFYTYSFLGVGRLHLPFCLGSTHLNNTFENDLPTSSSSGRCYQLQHQKHHRPHHPQQQQQTQLQNQLNYNQFALEEFPFYTQHRLSLNGIADDTANLLHPQSLQQTQSNQHHQQQPINSQHYYQNRCAHPSSSYVAAQFTGGNGSPLTISQQSLLRQVPSADGGSSLAAAEYGSGQFGSANAIETLPHQQQSLLFGSSYPQTPISLRTNYEHRGNLMGKL